MQKYFLYIIFIVFIISCGDDKKNDPEAGSASLSNACASDDPVSETQWLKDLKSSFVNCTCQISIIKASYKGRMVFYLLMNDPLCNGVARPVLHDCEGNIVKVFGDINDGEFHHTVKNSVVIYTCKS